jgi:hypothetical protein
MPTKLTHEIITAAILGFEQQKTHIDVGIAELRALLPGGPAETAPRPEVPIRKRKKFSAASRRKMALAQKARWAKIKGESEPSAPAKTPRAKRRISKEGMARIIAATKKRWRLQKAAVKAKSAAKKATPARKKAAVKRAVTKKATAKKTTPAAAQGAMEAAGQ